MSKRIDQFCEDLRQKYTIAASGLDGLRAQINGKAAHVDLAVHNHLERVRKRVEQGRAKVAAAQTEIKNWADKKKAVTGDKIADWKEKLTSYRSAPIRPNELPQPPRLSQLPPSMRPKKQRWRPG